MLAGLDYLYPILKILRERKTDHTVEMNATLRLGRSGWALYRSIHTNTVRGCILNRTKHKSFG
jgi:hypothetical protein